MADPNHTVFMCALRVFAGQSRSTQHMKKRSCAAHAPSHACKQAREPLALFLHASASAG